MAIKDKRAVYAGSQVQAAGILFKARDTGQMLTILRSPNVVDPSCWCSAGGKMEQGETPEQAARRECSEELGFNGEVECVPAFVYESEGLRFHNFIGLVDTEFQPKLNWESSGYAWTDIGMMPGPHHYGLLALLEDDASSKIIHSKDTP